MLFVLHVQAHTNGVKCLTSNKVALPLKPPADNSTECKENITNGAVEEPNKHVEINKTEINNETPKKNIVKVKKVRRKVNNFLHVF